MLQKAREPQGKHPGALTSHSNQVWESLSRLDLTDLPSGRGRAHAPLVWLALASYLGWNGKRSMCRDVWPSNATLSEATGVPMRVVAYSLSILRAAGKIEVRKRKRGRHGYGRVIKLIFDGSGPNPKIVLPNPAEMVEIWDAVSAVRERPASAVALAVAARVVAEAERLAGRRPRNRSPEASSTLHETTARPALLRRLVGACAGSTFQMRLAALEAAEILSLIHI